MGDYNGWANRATWAVHLWLGNDEGLYHAALEAAAGPGAMRELVDLAVESVAGFADDLRGASLDDVDWDAVVAAFTEV